MDSDKVEKEYVHLIYTRLATYQHNENKSSNLRIWPRVRQFVEAQQPGSIIVDVGCGESKYASKDTFVMGFDTCTEVLVGSVDGKNLNDVQIANAMSMPYKDGVVDAILNVSVIHHLSTGQKRRSVLQECSRCMRPGGKMLIYVWAFEQPNGVFQSQDLLVPWNLHENMLNGRLPKVKFHHNSTKEQRTIEASIPVQIAHKADHQACPSPGWLSGIMSKVQLLKDSLRKPEKAKIPLAAPQFFPSTNQILSGIKRWSPKLGQQLSSLLVPVEEQFGEELANRIMEEGMTEAMAAIREVKFYRYYHVFRKGELEDLVGSVGDLRIVESAFEHANWYAIVEKVEPNTIRP